MLINKINLKNGRHWNLFRPDFVQSFGVTSTLSIAAFWFLILISTLGSSYKKDSKLAHHEIPQIWPSSTCFYWYSINILLPIMQIMQSLQILHLQSKNCYYSNIVNIVTRKPFSFGSWGIYIFLLFCTETLTTNNVAG